MLFRSSNAEIKEVLEKAKKRDGLSYKDIAILLQAEDKNDLEEIYKLAGEIKKDIYGKRVVVFAPLYVSDYCVNNCVYCGYKRDNKFTRRKLRRFHYQEVHPRLLVAIFPEILLILLA